MVALYLILIVLPPNYLYALCKVLLLIRHVMDELAIDGMDTNYL